MIAPAEPRRYLRMSQWGGRKQANVVVVVVTHAGKQYLQ
jgi:hypothetical protein